MLNNVSASFAPKNTELYNFYLSSREVHVKQQWCPSGPCLVISPLLITFNNCCTVPHRLLEAGFKVGHVLDVLSTGVLARRYHLFDFLQQLLLSIRVTWQVENNPQHAVGGLYTQQGRKKKHKQGGRAETSLMQLLQVHSSGGSWEELRNVWASSMAPWLHPHHIYVPHLKYSNSCFCLWTLEKTNLFIKVKRNTMQLMVFKLKIEMCRIKNTKSWNDNSSMLFFFSFCFCEWKHKVQLSIN